MVRPQSQYRNRVDTLGLSKDEQPRSYRITASAPSARRVTVALKMAKPNYYGLILAGGRGTRFWPRSRKAQAKQVLRFMGEASLIQNTVARLKPVLPPERIWVLTNPQLQATIREQLPEVPAEQILAEPAQRNTAPAIGLMAHMLNSI